MHTNSQMRREEDARRREQRRLWTENHTRSERFTDARREARRPGKRTRGESRRAALREA